MLHSIGGFDVPYYTSLGAEGVCALQRRCGCFPHQFLQPQVTVLATVGHATSLHVSPPAVGHINQEVMNPKSSRLVLNTSTDAILETT